MEEKRYGEKLPGFWMAYRLAGPVHLGLALHVTGSEQYLHSPTTSVPISVSQLLQVPCPANKRSGDLHTLLLPAPQKPGLPALSLASVTVLKVALV